MREAKSKKAYELNYDYPIKDDDPKPVSQEQLK
jgi:hypothetical protein